MRVKVYSVVFFFCVSIVFLIYQFRDDISERLLCYEDQINIKEANDKDELARITLKLAKYYCDSLDEEAFRRLIGQSMENAEKARQMSDALYRIWMKEYKRKARFYQLTRKVATLWMLRSAEQGDPMARLVLELDDYQWFFFVDGFHDKVATAKAIEEICKKTKLTMREIDVLSVYLRRKSDNSLIEKRLNEYLNDLSN